MKLTVSSISVTDEADDERLQLVSSHIDLEFDTDGCYGGAGIGINFEIENARDMTFSQLEKIVLEKARAVLK
ncbi:hypothetical protein K8374_18250 [Pseudomonas sp. p1(2021b)]|uniref:hypothetical protein n=1 Tax=Pseudomonas sp. p1(2021b) TaxID=2874628 RepID=UPI001CC8FBB7|nr:hypothetical protein [Pseudomonas sp. p1(2021b)]UBM24297.1 hypothetical protein K8374_18250 [Pseudomonas sp. p1(2021b)]